MWCIQDFLASFLGCCEIDLRRPSKDLEELLAKETVFSIIEIKSLYGQFKKIRVAVMDGYGPVIDKEEFRSVLSKTYKKNIIFADRVFDMIDTKHAGVIGFEEFARVLSVFHKKATVTAKINFLFKVYDIKQQGFIERQEVREIIETSLSQHVNLSNINTLEDLTDKVSLSDKLKESLVAASLSQHGVNIGDAMIEIVTDQTLEELQPKEDGKIDKKEWSRLVIYYPALLIHVFRPDLVEHLLSENQCTVVRDKHLVRE